MCNRNFLPISLSFLSFCSIEKTYFSNVNFISLVGSTLDKSSIRMKKDLIVKVKKPALRSPVGLSAIEIHARGRAFSTH